MKVLVTGGAGYIGSHAAKALAAAGYCPVTLDDLSNGHRGAVKWGPLEVGSILDRDFLDAVLARWRPAAVLHFAALILAGESVSRPAPYYRTNVVGTLTLLEAMQAQGVATLVYSSTCAVYGTPAALPLTEDAPPRPINPYGATKLAAEGMIRDLAAAHGLSYALLRYFNAAGADPAGEIGERHEPEPHLIPNLIEAARGRREAVDIYGTDYDTPDGTCIRDYVHVSDLAEAHVLSLGRLLDGGGPLVLNLGTGRGHSVREVVAAVERVAGRPVPTREAPRRTGDPPVLYASAERAGHELGWAPSRPAIDDMVADAWRWATAGPKAAG